MQNTNTNLTCGDIMTPNVETCLPSDPVMKAAQLMKQDNVGPILVVESQQSKRLVGIVTDRDLALQVVATGRDPKSTRVEEVMSRNLYTCNPNDNVSKALQLMEQHQVRRVPIVDNNQHIVGIIAQADIATRLDQPRKTGNVVEQISEDTGGNTGRQNR